MGRITYEGFAAAWPSMTDEGGFADKMNSMPKYVASTTLTETTWNASLIKGDVAEEVAKLKQQPGNNLLVLGSGQLAATLREHNLIDEYQLLVHPVVLGSGKRLFKERSTGQGSDVSTLQLVDTRTTSKGVLILTYRPAQPA